VALPTLGIQAPVDRGRRLKVFCDVYGLEDRHGFVNLIQERIDDIRRVFLHGAAIGHPGYQALLDEGGHIEGLERDLLWVDRHTAELQDWVDRPFTRNV